MIEKDDVFRAEDKLYVVLDALNYNGHEYCLCNEMQDEKTFGPNYVVFENFDDGIEHVEDDDLLNTISPMFTNNFAADVYGENVGEE
jgi:hypothetical protein